MVDPVTGEAWEIDDDGHATPIPDEFGDTGGRTPIEAARVVAPVEDHRPVLARTLTVAAIAGGAVTALTATRIGWWALCLLPLNLSGFALLAAWLGDVIDQRRGGGRHG